MTPLFYIHQATCISPQQTFPDADLSVLHQPVDFKLKAIEPRYEGIPAGVLRRMSKSVRIGIGAALPLLKDRPQPDGIIVGTANAGFEECFHFLKQIIQYDEGQLTPGSFVQSTPNALAAQIGMVSHNKQYNITHLHRGLAFENALIDAALLLNENKTHQYLLGATDDISDHHYRLNYLAGWFKREDFDVKDLYQQDSPGSIAGEGACMYWVNNEAANALAGVAAVQTVHSGDEKAVLKMLQAFLAKHLCEGEKIDLLISGEDGDNRLRHFYDGCEKEMDAGTGCVRYKHLCGDYPTATAFAVWLACRLFQQQSLPAHMIKKNWPGGDLKNILVYNTHKGAQHSFILLRPVL